MSREVTFTTTGTEEDLSARGRQQEDLLVGALVAQGLHGEEGYPLW